MSRSEFPKRRLLGVAAMALALAAFSAPASAAGLGVSTGTQLGASAGGVNVDTGISSSVETRSATGTRNDVSAQGRVAHDAEIYQQMDPAVDIQLPEDPDAAYEIRDAQNTETDVNPQTTSYSGTRLYSETEAGAEAGAEAAQRTANAAIAVDNAVELGANNMRAASGGTVRFNE